MKDGWRGSDDDLTPPKAPVARPLPRPGFGPASSA
jgi:hypothetical protein